MATHLTAPLAHAMGVHPTDLPDDLEQLLVILGKGALWSEEYHSALKEIAKKIEEEFERMCSFS